ncbi:lecithin:cholesterol acyltransferase domain-containing protein [Ditylenchus destructor]|uniref:Lecithin:cholesterol acyltransferase domain-containing protein n=1 Tax=Ditylenchus destructor TaxID=166010 RepID=A0AAD4MZ95_9BILA|nr:lecithin:cholesterol acyltransferase domain-containing protein [Ditylenchus destructor]
MKFLALLILLGAIPLIYCSSNNGKPPVFLVNGILGSKLYIEENGVQYPSGCPATAGYRRIWISKNLGSSEEVQRCEFNLLSPVYNPSTGEFNDLPGANLTSPFGDLNSLQCLASDPWIGQLVLCSVIGGTTDTWYYYWFIRKLQTVLHYPVDDIIGAAYDWRYPPDSKKHNAYYQNLKEAIEKAYERTKLKVIIVAHSMGNKMMSFFLSDRVTSPEWRKKYVNFTYNAAPAFGGSVSTMEELATGHDIVFMKFITIINGTLVRNFGRSLPAMASLLPSPNVYDVKKPLVTVGDKAYTIENMDEFLSLINCSHLAPIRSGSEESQPDVKMVVVLGTGQKTPASFTYKSSVAEDPKREDVDGDGRIQRKVMEDLCGKWKAKGADIEVLTLKYEHSKLIESAEFLRIFRDHAIGKLPEDELDPLLRNYQVKRGREICFSAEPLPICPEAAAEVVLKETKSVPFVCFSKEDELVVKLENETKAGRFFDLNPEKAAFIAGIDIPARCKKN